MQRCQISLILIALLIDLLKNTNLFISQRFNKTLIFFGTKQSF